MRSIGCSPTEDELEELIDVSAGFGKPEFCHEKWKLQEADKDGSGTVDFFEFVNLMVKRENEKETEDDLKQVFRVFDKENRVFLRVWNWI